MSKDNRKCEEIEDDAGFGIWSVAFPILAFSLQADDKTIDTLAAQIIE